MRKLLNTLYVTSPDSYLSRDGLNVVVKIGEEEKFRLPIHNIEAIVTFGYMGVSPALLSLCTENNVSVCFLSGQGRFLARVSGKIRGNVLMRRQQYRYADDPDKALALSSVFVSSKIANCRNVVQRVIRDHGSPDEMPEMVSASATLALRQKQAYQAQTIEILRGIEGDAANQYFGIFNHMIISQKEHFHISNRNRRPPRDPVNAMLSFAYTLLANDVQSALETVGLDPYVGFLHTDRPGRPSLALDLMEELRPYLADRLVLTLINRKQIGINGFRSPGGIGIQMTDETRKEFITTWQKRKLDTILHPFLEENISVGLLPHVQAILLARYIRGDMEAYPAFIMK